MVNGEWWNAGDEGRRMQNTVGYEALIVRRES